MDIIIDFSKHKNTGIISATTKVILVTNKPVPATVKWYLCHHKVILATEEVITTVITSSVAKITFVVAEIIFKVAVITSSVVKISFEKCFQGI